jgi:hypothetical protein
MVLSLIDYMPLNICDIDLFHSVLCFVQIILKLCNHTRLLIVIYSDGICVIVVVQAAGEVGQKISWRALSAPANWT